MRFYRLIDLEQAKIMYDNRLIRKAAFPRVSRAASRVQMGLIRVNLSAAGAPLLISQIKAATAAQQIQPAAGEFKLLHNIFCRLYNLWKITDSAHDCALSNSQKLDAPSSSLN